MNSTHLHNVIKYSGRFATWLRAVEVFVNESAEIDKYCPAGEHEYGMHVNRCEIERADIEIVERIRRVKVGRDRIIEHTCHIDSQKPHISQIVITCKFKCSSFQGSRQRALNNYYL